MLVVRSPPHDITELIASFIHCPGVNGGEGGVPPPDLVMSAVRCGSFSTPRAPPTGGALDGSALPLRNPQAPE